MRWSSRWSPLTASRLSVHALTDARWTSSVRIASRSPPEARYLFDQPWDYLLCDDMADDPVMRQIPAVAAGLRGSLRVPAATRTVRPSVA